MQTNTINSDGTLALIVDIFDNRDRLNVTKSLHDEAPEGDTDETMT